MAHFFLSFQGDQSRDMGARQLSVDPFNLLAMVRIPMRRDMSSPTLAVECSAVRKPDSGREISQHSQGSGCWR